MDRALRNIIVGTGLWVGYLLFTNSKDNVKASSLRIQLRDVDIDWQRIRFILNISNPTSANIIVRSITGDLYVNGTRVGNVKTFGYFVIKSNSQYDLPVHVELKLGNALQEFLNMTKSNKGMRIDLVGSLNLNNELMPIKMTWNA